MKPARLVIVLVVGLVLVAGALFFLGMKRGERIDQLQKQAESERRYKGADIYLKGSEEDKKYVDGLFDYALGVVHNDLDSFFSPPPSEEKYFTSLYQVMIDQAKQQGKSDMARSFHGWVVGQRYLEVKF
jgi:hypothetical protein